MKNLAYLSSLLILFFSLVSQSYAQDVKEATIVLSAEMPDISSSDTASFAELHHLVNQNKERNSNTFFFFGGASIGPSALSNLDRGSHIIDILNSLEPDAMGVAKRDFSYFEDELSLRSYEAAFPIVASNIIDTRTNSFLDGLADRAMITKGDIKLGILSIVNERLIEEYLLKNAKVKNPLETIEAKAKALRDAGADIILLHYYSPYDFVPQLLQNKVIDIAYISNPRLTTSEREEISKHPKIMSMDVTDTAIVVKMAVDASASIRSIELVKLIDISPDPTVQAQVNAYKFRLDRLLDDRIGYWDGEFSTLREDVRSGQNAFANYVVDTMRKITDADVALINGGSIRGDRTYRKNAVITRRTIASELPFRTNLNVISIRGEQLLDAIEVGLAGLNELEGTFPHISGMSIVFDASNEAGNRVVSAKIEGKDIDLEKEYILATTDYLYNGGDGYKTLASGRQIQDSIFLDSILISDLVQRNVRLQGKLSSSIDDRLADISASTKK
ncbi:bifunctional metallophosphatase/5'-nucleotidase [Glaciecola sp. MF2-115]|uniref:bifunctional metallophosphatase/5'-nucleotidase n=1 Tax=Glaciecola sp. MF2-115 TaxID=3384827 RepID=UPI0039A2C1CB